MDIRKLQRLVVDALEDVKGADIRVFNSTGLTQLFDRVIIASGTSNRQTKALAASVRDKVKSAGGQVVSVEGEETGEWVLVDLGDAIVHVMQPAIRAYYNLEEIWGAKPVSLRSLDDADAAVSRSAASRQASAPERTSVARKAAPRKTAGPGSASTFVAAATSDDVDDAPVVKPARKTPGRGSTGPSSRTSGAGKTIAKAASKPAGARKTPARKSLATKSAPRKTASRKTPSGSSPSE